MNNDGLTVFDECKRSKNYSFKQFIQEFDIQKEKKSHLLVIEASRSNHQYFEDHALPSTYLSSFLTKLQSKNYTTTSHFQTDFPCPYDLSQPLLPQIKLMEDTPYFWIDTEALLGEALK